MRYHGNYCGPNWSAGEHQPSVVSDVPAIDEFDETCRVHDAAYARHSDLDAADQAFYDANIWQGGKRTLAALAVKSQQLLSTRTKNINPIFSMTNLRTNNLTKSNTSSTVTPSGKMPYQKRQTDSLVTAPAAVGSVLRGQDIKQVKSKDGSISINSLICLGRPSGAIQTTLPEMVGIQYLHPAVLGNDEIQNMTRVYEQFRITHARIRFRSFQGTSAGGEVMIISNADPNYRPINTGSNTNFYQRALATRHSLLTPIWLPEELELAVDPKWKVCDNSNSSTLEDFSAGVVYIYADGGTAIPGYFLLELSIEFKQLRFNSRSLISGSFQGLGVRNSATMVNFTLNADAKITLSGMTAGDIYAFVMSATGATFNGATNASNILQLNSGAGVIPYVLGGSNLLYARADTTTTAVLFTTYDAAIGSDDSDKLTWAITAAVTDTFPTCLIIQLRNSAQPTL